MELYKMVIDYLEYKKFDKKVNQVFQSIPSIEKYKNSAKNDWASIGKAQIKENKHTIKQILPLKSLMFGEDYGYGRFVTFSVREFNEVMYKSINRKIHTFLIDSYLNKDKKIRHALYTNTKDTFILLLDAVSENYHLEHENEIIELIEFLKTEFSEIFTVSSTTSDIKQRMEIELEFIKRRKEAQNLNFR